MKKLTFLLLFFLIFSLANEVMAQRYRGTRRISNYTSGRIAFSPVKRYNAIGVTVNALNYFGDLSPLSNALSTDISFTRPGIGIFAQHRFGPRYSLRLTASWGRLSASDESAEATDPDAFFRYARGLHFRNDIKELSLVAIFDLFPNNGTASTRVLFTPYLYVGGGLMFHNPQAKAPENLLSADGSPHPQAGQWVDLEPLGTEGQYSQLPADYQPVESYSKMQINFPLGLGIRYRVSSNLDFSFEMGARFLFFDYIDDVSGLYIDQGLFDTGDSDQDILARALSDRSREATFADSGTPRNFDVINGRLTLQDYVSDGDGATYTAYGGFGSYRGPTDTGDPGNLRGNSADNDFYWVTSFQLSYILGGGGFRKAKFR